MLLSGGTIETLLCPNFFPAPRISSFRSTLSKRKVSTNLTLVYMILNINSLHFIWLALSSVDNDLELVAKKGREGKRRRGKETRDQRRKGSEKEKEKGGFPSSTTKDTAAGFFKASRNAASSVECSLSSAHSNTGAAAPAAEARTALDSKLPLFPLLQLRRS